MDSLGQCLPGALKPVDALHVGRIDAVDAALEALDSGVFL